MNENSKIIILTSVFAVVSALANSMPNAIAGENGQVKPLLAVLLGTNETSSAKYQAIKSVDIHADRSTREALSHLALCDPEWQFRKQALWKLWEVSMERKDCRALLFDTAVKATRDSDGCVRETACIILRHQPTDANAVALVEALHREFTLERDERGAKSNRRLSLRKSWWRDSVVRSCVESLVWMGKSSVAAVESGYRKYSDGDTGYALLDVLYELGQAPDVEKMCRGVRETSSEFVKVRLIHALRAIGDRRAIPVLKECLEDYFQIQTKEWKIIYPVREAAMRALEAIG